MNDQNVPWEQCSPQEGLAMVPTSARQWPWIREIVHHQSDSLCDASLLRIGGFQPCLWSRQHRAWRHPGCGTTSRGAWPIKSDAPLRCLV